MNEDNGKGQADKGEDNGKGQADKGKEKVAAKVAAKKGISQYLIDKEKNIEKNRQLLAPFFNDINDALKDWKEEEQGIKRKKKEGKKTKAGKGKGKAKDSRK
jgi:hypothetical protein